MGKYAILLALGWLLTACQAQQSQYDTSINQRQTAVQRAQPDWIRSATVYQINIRQFSEEGTISAASQQLPRLKSLGIDIIWLMPIHPIGEQNRKGSLGSPYAVKDFFAVNPELGNMADIKQFVSEAHDLGMYVILDWVANHTAWDNVIKNQHPDWYIKDYKGDYIPTLWFDWSDIIDLDYSNPALQDYMLEAMRFWVDEVGIDGYRCDAAGLVPGTFWQKVSRELNQIKPVFMLAEWEGPQFYDYGFDATYAWSWWSTMHKIAQGEAKANAFHSYYAWNDGYYPDHAIRLMYTSNHDVNAWEATQFEAFGDALPAAITLSVISEGMPMIYNGQEAGLNKRLAFFEKDPIEWQDHELSKFFQSLFALKKANSALWNGKWGARMLPIHSDNTENVLSFVRQNDNDKVVAVFNLSDQPQQVGLLDPELFSGDYQEFFSGKDTTLTEQASFALAPWQVKLFVKP